MGAVIMSCKIVILIPVLISAITAVEIKKHDDVLMSLVIDVHEGKNPDGTGAFSVQTEEDRLGETEGESIGIVQMEKDNSENGGIEGKQSKRQRLEYMRAKRQKMGTVQSEGVELNNIVDEGKQLENIQNVSETIEEERQGMQQVEGQQLGNGQVEEHELEPIHADGQNVRGGNDRDGLGSDLTEGEKS